MKCFYINESMLQDNEFSKNVLQRFLNYYRHHHGEILFISAIGEVCLDTIPEDIAYIINPSTFAIDSLQGEVMVDHLLLNDFRLDGVYSGMCIAYDSVTNEIERIYFDFINNSISDITNRIMDEVQAMLEEMQIKKHFYN